MRFSAIALASLLAAQLGETSALPQYEHHEMCTVNWNTVNLSPLGTPPLGCSWKKIVTCLSIITQCGAACGLAAIEEGLNPFLDLNCAACAGTAAGVCAQCWDVSGGRNAACHVSNKLPKAACLKPICDGRIGDCVYRDTC